MIRAATLADIPALVEMGRGFHRMSDVPSPFVADDVAEFLGNMIQNPQCHVLRSDSGAIGAVLVPSFAAKTWVSALELFWWAQDRSGIKLLRGLEDWARSKAAEVRMSTLAANDRPGRILERLGYDRAETGYVKVF